LRRPRCDHFNRGLTRRVCATNSKGHPDRRLASRAAVLVTCYGVFSTCCCIDAPDGQRHDPCLLDTFIAAVRYMEGGPKKPWWEYTAQRKRELAARNAGSG
jgi:hypothetical protein